MGALGLDGSTSLVGLDPVTARTAISKLPWVENASVRKIYPATLAVNLQERKPFALWQQGETLSVIEKDGSIIAPYTNTRFGTLPLVVGTGAAERASAFISGMQRFPGIASRVKGYVRVADRRWDLRLGNGITIRLPERGALKAVENLAAIEDKDGLLERDVVAVDMRFADRIVLQLSPEAAEAHSEHIKELIEQAKKNRGRHI